MNRTLTARHYLTGQPTRITWEHGRVASIENVPSSAANLWMAPTLVDLQVNGYAGVDFQQDNLRVEDLVMAAQGLRRDGCARWLLTLITEEWPKLTARLRHLRALREQSPELGHALAGWHIEGPFLSAEPGFHGTHRAGFMIDPKPAHIRELRDITGDDPLLLTIAPERRGAIEAIALAVSLGFKVSLGHTDASTECLREALAAGATGFTHLGNGCPSELNRHDNILWRVLEIAESDTRLTVSLIPDGHHVRPAPFRLFHRLLGAGSVYYTTDAMAAAGAPPGRYRLGGLELEVGADRIVREPGRSNFAGSALPPIDGVFRAARMLNQRWAEAWRRFSETPARFMGWDNALNVGSPAELFLVEVTDDGEVKSIQQPCLLPG